MHFKHNIFIIVAIGLVSSSSSREIKRANRSFHPPKLNNDNIWEKGTRVEHSLPAPPLPKAPFITAYALPAVAAANIGIGKRPNPITPKEEVITKRDTTSKKAVRYDCPPEKDLCNQSNSNPCQNDCAMDTECLQVVCIDENESSETTKQFLFTTSSTIITAKTNLKDYRYDCPPSFNFCGHVDPCKKHNKLCAMNLKCTDYKCVEKKTPVQETFNANCPAEKDLCQTSPCLPTQLCKMDLQCTNSICVDKTTSGTTDEISTTRSKTCPSSNDFRCVHGYCKEDTTPEGISMHCVCDKGWTRDHCQLPCTLDCVHGTCLVDPSIPSYTPPEKVTKENMTCNCQVEWEGSLCQSEIPDLVDEAERKVLKLGVGLSIALFVVIMVSGVVLFILWRKRVIVVMKLVYFFKVEETNDGRNYDAYISMGTSRKGIEFVKDKLCPMLEDSGFKVYIQERDLLGGAVLSESIPEAMEQSRRTILIITPDYLRNEWGYYECVFAQFETLRMHQRIIPIVLEDISAEKQNMNRTLKHILASVKCLKFPSGMSTETMSLKQQRLKEEQFWKRLRLTMPKKRKCKDKEPATELSQVDEDLPTDSRPIDISTVSVMYKAI